MEKGSSCLCAVALSGLMLFSGVPVAFQAIAPDMAFAEESEAGNRSGSIAGTELTWSYDAASETMTISGVGDVPNRFMGTTTTYTELSDFVADGKSPAVSVKKLIIGDGVTSVGVQSFRGLYDLEEVYLGSGLELIDSYAFRSDGYKLKKVSFEKCANLKEIGIGAFRGHSLSEIVPFSSEYTFSPVLESIGGTSFSANTAQGSSFSGTVKLPALCEETGDTFPNMTGVVVEYVGSFDTDCWSYEDGVLTIKPCDSYTGPVASVIKRFDEPVSKVVIEEGVTSITSSMLSSFAETVESIQIPASVETIGNVALSGLKKITTVEFPAGSRLGSVGDKAFSQCPELTSIDLSGTQVKSLNEGVFLRCDKLKEVRLPGTLEELGSIFNGTQVDSIVVPSSCKRLTSAALFDSYTTVANVVLPATLEQLSTSAIWSSYNVTVCGVSENQAQKLEELKSGVYSSLVNNVPSSNIHFVQHAAADVSSYTANADGSLSFVCDLCGKEAHYQVAVTAANAADHADLKVKVEAHPSGYEFVAPYDVFISEVDGSGISAQADDPESVHLDKPVVVTATVPDNFPAGNYVAFSADGQNPVPAQRSGNQVTFQADAPGTYALARATKATLSFDTAGGSAVESQTVALGEKPVKPADPTREGYTFLGWFTSADGDTAFDFDAAMEQDATAYAKWERTGGDEPAVTGDEGDGAASSDAGSADKSTAADDGKKLPQTGDTAPVVATVSVSVLAAFAAMIAALKRRRRFNGYIR